MNRSKLGIEMENLLKRNAIILLTEVSRKSQAWSPVSNHWLCFNRAYFIEIVCKWAREFSQLIET